MVARGGGLGDAGRALGVEPRQEHGALDLRARHLGLVGNACRRAPCTVRGAWPSVASIRAPIRSSGSMTRRIGRGESDASPMNRLENGCPATTPAISRIVVPEFPASSGSAGELRRPIPRPIKVTDASCGTGVLTSTPRPPRQASVDRQSAPDEKFVSVGLAVGKGGQQGVAMGNGLVARDRAGVPARGGRGRW